MKKFLAINFNKNLAKKGTIIALALAVVIGMSYFSSQDYLNMSIMDMLMGSSDGCNNACTSSGKASGCAGSSCGTSCKNIAGEPHSLPTTGTANSTQSRYYVCSGNTYQSRSYDSDGNASSDTDYGHDHGCGKPHTHQWVNGQRQSAH